MSLLKPHIRPNPRAGFSLPEVLMAVTIMGIVAAIVAPRVDLARFQVDSGMREVATTLMLAQKEAVASQHEVLVGFDTAARTLVIHWDQDNDHAQDAGERIRRVPLADGVTFGRPSGVTARAFGSTDVVFDAIGGMPTVVFHRNGSTSESGGLYLTSVRSTRAGASYPNDTRAIEFERASGRTEWFRYRGSWLRGF
jgi:prepilin-type N-terminal cleavage/methylation domain-containing protein